MKLALFLLVLIPLVYAATIQEADAGIDKKMSIDDIISRIKSLDLSNGCVEACVENVHKFWTFLCSAACKIEPTPSFFKEVLGIWMCSADTRCSGWLFYVKQCREPRPLPICIEQCPLVQLSTCNRVAYRILCPTSSDRCQNLTLF